MTSVFDVLAQDHAEVKRMLTELELGPTAATGADADELALRKRMVQQLVIEVSKHEAVEEMYFWPAVRSHVTDGRENAPTRPHPKTPASPGVLKTAGPAIAAADRLRDAATGRDE